MLNKLKDFFKKETKEKPAKNPATIIDLSPPVDLFPEHNENI